MSRTQAKAAAFARRIIATFVLHRRLIPLTAALVLAGCASFAPTRDDQLRSWEEIGPTTIRGPLRFPEVNGIAAEQVDARNYLFMVSVGVLASKDAGAFQRLERMIAATAENRACAPPAEMMNATAPPAENGFAADRTPANKGSGVAVTVDGYIVTAAHLVRDSEILVLHFEIVAKRVVPRTARARVVFVDGEADFALIKCEVATPRYLEIRSDAISKGAPMFSGGWWNERGAGRLLRVREFRSESGHVYRRLRSSIPMLHGDSGSALIDCNGHLAGVTVHSLWGRFWRQAPKSDAVMLDPPELHRLIEEDRARHLDEAPLMF
jgi:hypothetical protein